MKRRVMRSAMAMAALGAVALLGGCGSTSGPQEVVGTWEGSLALGFVGGGGLNGGLTLELDQANGFASGGARWVPIGEVQSIAGPIDTVYVTFRMIFRCEEGFETAVLEGTVSGDTITIGTAAGTACTLGGAPVDIASGSASLARARDNVPL